ncbi:Flp pilus assembly protein TadG [Novosphingobium taihuense]|uniref:Flp pilus assembly protein TadG n=2 Tax=Novosphingobium taihuense TaxID=260085 RepID=A0A7W7AF24_9SPHN|nr:Flp pilus assembly protein TadG [Novosphingobium taihuense]TWH79588.1 Flp pilus assembly protein TadG [Novosphingobium taihuense]
MMRRLTRLLRSLAADNRGAAAMETVLIAPIAIFVLCMAIESGHFLYSEHQVLKGVRDAARYASRLPLSTWNCSAVAAEQNLSTANAAWSGIANVAVYGSVTAGSNARLWSWSAASGAGEVEIKYQCVAQTTGIYSETGVAPLITVIGKPNYPSLLKSMGGFDSDLTLFARQQAVGIGV